MAVTTRLARAEDFPELERRLRDGQYDAFSFEDEPCVVAEADGLLCGMLPIRLRTNPVPIWQPEPLTVWCAPLNTRRRAMYLLWKAAEQWIVGELNQTGIRRYIAVTYLELPKKLFASAGLIRLSQQDAAPFAWLSKDDNPEFFFRQL